MIKYCKKCVNPSTRPNTFFNGEGLCPVCVYEKEKLKKSINWDVRWKEIQKIKKWGKKNTKNTGCVHNFVPFSRFLCTLLRGYAEL